LSSPLLFAEVLSSCDDKLYAKRAALMSSLRLVPTEDAFSGEQLIYYAEARGHQFKREQWSVLARALMD
jgi:hypothetical protein